MHTAHIKDKCKHLLRTAFWTQIYGLLFYSLTQTKLTLASRDNPEMLMNHIFFSSRQKWWSETEVFRTGGYVQLYLHKFAVVSVGCIIKTVLLVLALTLPCLYLNFIILYLFCCFMSQISGGEYQDSIPTEL